jgi:hypothetical protein
MGVRSAPERRIPKDKLSMYLLRAPIANLIPVRTKQPRLSSLGAVRSNRLKGGPLRIKQAIRPKAAGPDSLQGSTRASYAGMAKRAGLKERRDLGTSRGLL